MRTAVSVYDFLTKRIVALTLEAGVPHVKPYVYTGIVVAIEGYWFWITAAHCSQSISAALKAYSGAKAQFVTLTGGEARRVLIKEPIKFIDFQEELRLWTARHPGSEVTSNHIKHFDFAAWPLGDVVPHLLNKQIAPFTGEQVIYDADAIIPLLNKNGGEAMYSAGFPELSVSIEPGSPDLAFGMRIFPLHPYPDGDSPTTSERVVHFEGQHTWLPTAWGEGEWDHHTVGVSGGPVVAVIGDHTILLGVQTSQKPSGQKPAYIGLCDAPLMFTLLKRAIEVNGRSQSAAS